MNRRYNKKKYYKRKSKTKYNPTPDIAIGVFILLFVVYYNFSKLYKENPTQFWIQISFCILLIIGVVFIRKKIKERRYMKIKTLQDMKNMDRRDFERFIAFVFKKKGFKAKERQGTNDGGIDVDATKDGKRYAIQCKKRKNTKIGAIELRSFIGAVDAVGENVIGIYITTSRLTKEAQKYVEKMNHRLEIWDADNLEEYIQAFTSKKNK